MAEPIWLSKELVLAIHAEQLAMFGGGVGLHDEGLLESALARPMNLLRYNADATLFDLAAEYCDGIVRNHPFVDGNKRTGDLTIQAFLYQNGWRFDPNQVDEVQMILALAAGDRDEADLARWIKANSVPK